MTDESQSVSIPNGSLLAIANNILDLLEYGSELDNEDDLFRDEFYIAIVSHLVTDEKFDISPGETEIEKIASLDKLITFLSSIIEIDLAHISAQGIIKNHDKVSTKYLLELIEELIKALKKENEEAESQSYTSKTKERLQGSNENLDESSSSIKKHNISDNNIIQQKHNLLDEDEDEDEDKDEAVLSSPNKQKEIMNEPADLEIHDPLQKSNDHIEQEQSNSLKDIETSHNQQETERNYDKDSESERRAHSCFEELLLIKAQQGFDESLLRKTFTENDITRLERELANNEEEEMEHPDNYPMGINYEEGDNKQNETPVMNVSHISEVSKSKENSEQQGKINSKKGKTDSVEKKKRQHQDKEQPIQNENEEIPSYQNKNSQSNSCYVKNSEQLDEEEMRSEEELTDSNKEFITENVAHSVPDLQPKIKINCSTSSSKKEIKGDEQFDKKKQNKDENKSEKKSQSDISQSSIHSNSQKSQTKHKNKQAELNENILEELPLNDENLKYEIMKEFRRLYGNKLDRIFLKHNLQNSHDTLEVILRNIKLARQKMMSIANRIPEPDDLLTKEFIHKYEKELQYIIEFYRKEKNKRNIFQERALKTITKNVQEMTKIQEVSNSILHY